VAAVTIYSVPDDGRKGRPKHVEHKQYCQSCSLLVYYMLWKNIHLLLIHFLARSQNH